MNHFITRAELAQRWAVSLSTINKWSRIFPEKLPPQAKFCGRWRFQINDVISFETNLTTKQEQTNGKA